MTTEIQEPGPPTIGPIEEPPASARRPFRWPISGLPRRMSRLGAGVVRRMDWRVAGLVLVVGSSILGWRAVTVHAKTLAKPMPALPAPPVAVAKVTRQDLYNEVTFVGEFRPYVEVDLHAKVSGYVRDMKVDFGDRVKAGQLLATLEVPELQDELHNAIATMQKAEADYTNAHLIYQRLVAANKAYPSANLIAQQELDTAEAKERTTFAAIAATKADVEKYQTLVDYTRITAPFDGVITKRYADPGALIQAGTASDTQSLPLVRVSDNYRLRLDFDVEVRYVKDIHVGDPITVGVDSLGGETFDGAVTRAALKVTEDTRTMMTEIEVPNPKLEIVPGMYATACFKPQRRLQALAIPIAAVAGDKKKTVYLVNSHGQIEERTVKLGLETAGSYEVLSGLREGDLVLIGDRSKVKPGQTVEAKLIGPLAQQ